MKRNVQGISLALVGLGIGFGATVQAQNKGRPTRIGVVDIGILFKDYKRKDDLEAKINQEREDMKGEIEGDEKRLAEKAKALENGPLRKGSAPWQQQADLLREEQFRLELKQKRLQQALQKRVEENTLQILEELESTIKSYADPRRFALVLKVDKSGPDTSDSELSKKFQEQIFRAQISDVLYYDTTVDITEEVKTLLNSAENLRRLEKESQEQGK
ncbi:MAG: OmpH family outer membrane protein [Planctomycetota bacterium]